MGERNKLLELWRGRALIAHSCEVLLRCDQLHDVCVVTGHDDARVRACVHDHHGHLPTLSFTHAPDHAQGMSATLRAGVRHAAHASHLLIALGDMPAITPSTLIALTRAARAHPSSIVRPAHQGRHGHPVVFPAWTFPDLLALSGDRGARDLLRARTQHVHVVDVDDPGVLLDLDTPQAFEVEDQ